MKDCCDCEIIAWRAWIGRGLPGEPVRDMMIEAVEARFGSTDQRAIALEFLSDNGGAFRVIETHALARELGIKPIHTPVNSPQSNGMAESFVNTFKRDYVGAMDRSNGAAVLAQLPDAFRHFNEVHPHSALGYKSWPVAKDYYARRLCRFPPCRSWISTTRQACRPAGDSLIKIPEQLDRAGS
jgi:putative transposase